MNKKTVIILIPLLILIDFISINYIFKLLNAPSDTSVTIGAVLLCLFIGINYLLIQFIYKKIKNTSHEK